MDDHRWEKFGEIRDSPHFHSAPVDGHIVTTRFDGVETRIFVTLTRQAIHHRTVEQQRSQAGAPPRLRTVGEPCMIREFDAVLTPQTTAALIESLLSTLSSLSPEQLSRYAVDLPTEG